jgi:lysozyme
MRTSQVGLKLIRQSETLRLTAYHDCGNGVLTIGWGHTGPDVHEGQRIDWATADFLFMKDIADREPQLASLLKVEVTQGQWDALMSFMFNEGFGNLRKSALLQFVNSENITLAAGEFSRWVYAGGERKSGLVRRRSAEKALFLS